MKLVMVVCVAIASACCIVGCLGGDDTSTPGPGSDSGLTGDSQVPIFDASGQVDGQNLPPPTPDAGEDAGIDSAIPDAGVDSAPPPPDASVTDSGITGISGLVTSGTLSKSASYSLTGSGGPATGIVARSKNYQLVGGMAVSTQP